MFTFFLTLAVIAIWIYALVIASRLRSARQQHEDELQALARRVWLLENAAEAGHQPPAPEPVFTEPVAAPAPAIQPEPPPEREPAYAPAGSYASRLDHLIGEGLPEPVPAPVASVSEPLFQESTPVEPADVEPVRQKPTGQGWEAALGGSWLNKIGVLLVVIGLVLFIRYSFSMMGPAGRVAVSVAVSASMLMAGVVLERREKYRVAARGLIGGGWAALYATTFAAHTIEAARVIESPTLATLLLAAVALGMVLHSLRYRSQTVTGVAYFVAFVTLAITQLTVFAVVALVPLAASLLYLAHRFRWTAMALAGLPATYGIYMLHAARSSGGSLALGQTVLLIYWLVFEGFEVFDSMRRRTEGGNPSAVFPLNAICFTAVSAMQWAAVSQSRLYQFFELAAAAYLGSTLVRALLLPPSGFPAECSVLDRARRGGYEGAVTLAATFAAVAVALKLSGLSLAVALMTEAELLFLAGLQLRQAHLRHLAAALFGVANLRLIASDVPEGRQVTIAGSLWYAWSPVALLEAAVFYLNRFVCHRGAFYSSFAAGLLTLVLGFETPLAYLGLAWVLLAVVLSEFGGARHHRDFTLQSYCVGFLGLLALLMKNVGETALHTDWHGWLPQLCAAILLYAVTIRIGVQTSPDSVSSERLLVRYVTATAASVLALVFLANILRLEFLGLAWLLLAVALYELGLAARLRELVVQGYIVGSSSLLALLLNNILNTGRHTDWYGWLPQLCAALLLYAVTIRIGVQTSPDSASSERLLVRYVTATAGSVLALVFLANILRLEFLGLAWLLLAVVLYELGLAARLRELVVQGYLVGISSLLALLLNNVLNTGRHTDWYGWLPQLCGAVLLYAIAARVGIFSKPDADSSERGIVCHVSAMAGTVLSAAFLLNVLETGFVGLAWLLLAVALYEFSLFTRLQEFAVQGYLAGLASLLMLVAKNVVDTGLHTDWHGWLPQLASAAVLYAVAARSRMLRGRHWSQTGEEVVSDLPSLIGTLLTAAFLANTLPDAARAIGWAVLGLVLLAIGTRLGNIMLRMQSYVLAVVAFYRAWSFNLTVEGQVAGLPLSIVTAAAVIASFYASELLAPRAPANLAPGDELQSLEAYARFLFSWLGTLLLAALLFHEVSDKMRTVAWGIQGLGLLFAGFPLRERPMRFAGLFLLLVCVLKLFVWDLRNLDMPFRVLSFIVLGVILIGVSFFYSRYRERITRYM